VSIQRQPEEALSYYQRLVNMGRATATDLNNLAWTSLVMNAVAPEFIRTAERAVQTGEANPVPLHTLASLYAEIGEGVKARDVLLQSMQVGGRDEPDHDDWYVLGRIAEQFGENDAATEAYRKVEKPADDMRVPESTYTLAQRRLTAMGRSPR